MKTILVLYVLSGILLIAVALPLLFGKIPPNPFYGFRLSPALEDASIWYPTNRHSAKWLILSGVSTVVSAVALYFVPWLTIDAYAWSCLAVFAVVTGVGLVQSIRYMKALARAKDGG